MWGLRGVVGGGGGDVRRPRNQRINNLWSKPNKTRFVLLNRFGLFVFVAVFCYYLIGFYLFIYFGGCTGWVSFCLFLFVVVVVFWVFFFFFFFFALEFCFPLSVTQRG